MAKSYNEKIVTAFFREHGIPAPLYEYQFTAPRRWRFDLAWPVVDCGKDLQGCDTVFLLKLALEVQGGVFSGGAHVRGGWLRKEHEKRNHAAAMGWRILYVFPEDLLTVSTVLFIKQAFGWL